MPPYGIMWHPLLRKYCYLLQRFLSLFSACVLCLSSSKTLKHLQSNRQAKLSSICDSIVLLFFLTFVHVVPSVCTAHQKRKTVVDVAFPCRDKSKQLKFCNEAFKDSVRNKNKRLTKTLGTTFYSDFLKQTEVYKANVSQKTVSNAYSRTFTNMSNLRQ